MENLIIVKGQHRMDFEIMDFEKVKQAIDIPTKAGSIMAQVVASTYWDGLNNMCLNHLGHLDRNNFCLALSVITYRRTKRWDDERFWELAKYAKLRLEQESHFN